MRKTFVMLGLFALCLIACVGDGNTCERRGRGSGAYDGLYYRDGRAYNYSPGDVYADTRGPTEFRRSFYYDPSYPDQSSGVRILVPNPDAEVWFDGATTTQRGLDRVFVTPALNQESTYTIKARWMENGKAVEQERRVQIRGGQAHTVDFRVKEPEKVPTPQAPDEAPKKLPPSITPKEKKSSKEKASPVPWKDSTNLARA